MRLLLIWNRRAREHPSAGELLARVRRRKRWTVREVDSAEEFAAAVQVAVRDGFDRIVVPGGDGTVHAALNAVESSGTTAFALVPLGTGNDLARTLSRPFEPLEAMKLAERRMQLINEAWRAISAKEAA